jgi:type I restriction enzyme, R subunit
MLTMSQPKDPSSEKSTRIKYIDPELHKRGWLDKYVKAEANSVKSDFPNKRYLYYDGSPEKVVDRFIDYLLLAEDYSPLVSILIPYK